MLNSFLNIITNKNPKEKIIKLQSKPEKSEPNIKEKSYDQKIRSFHNIINNWLHENNAGPERIIEYGVDMQNINNELKLLGLSSTSAVLLLKDSEKNELIEYLKNILGNDGFDSYLRKNLSRIFNTDAGKEGTYQHGIDLVIVNLDVIESSSYYIKNPKLYINGLVFHEKVHSDGNINKTYNEEYNTVHSTEGRLGDFSPVLEEGYTQMITAVFQEHLQGKYNQNIDYTKFDKGFSIIPDNVMLELKKYPGFIYEDKFGGFSIPSYQLQGLVFSKISEILGEGFLEIIRELRANRARKEKYEIYESLKTEMQKRVLNIGGRKIGLYDYVTKILPSIKFDQGWYKAFGELIKAQEEFKKIIVQRI